MALTLYHYVHCPFCVRVRLALGFLGLAYQSKVLSYDDETTPVQLTGKKMLPIMVIEGNAMNESLEIIERLDSNNQLNSRELRSSAIFTELEKLLTSLGNPVHSLAMPYWIYTPEFDQKSRTYFQQKKEEKRGPFRQLYQRRREFMQEVSELLSATEKDLKPFYRSDRLSLLDIMLVSHLWGLYVVPEFQFSESWHSYLQTVRQKCSFDYHQDFWS